jgi:hypothetical protein
MVNIVAFVRIFAKILGFSAAFFFHLIMTIDKKDI